MKKLMFTLIVSIVSMITLQAQNFNRSMNLNVQIVNDTTFNPFDGNAVTSNGITGQVTFTSDLGFIRFVVSDSSDDEYLIYESYRIFEDDNSFSFTQKCEESCFYEAYTPNALKVYVYDAEMTISSISYSNIVYENPEYKRRQAVRAAYLEELSSVQNYILDNHLIWVADSTRLSKMSYALKAQIYGKGYRDYGLEFYSKGYFDIACSQFRDDDDQSYGNVAYFDWRARHDANNASPNSKYYNEYGNGWITHLSCQGEGCEFDTCSFIIFLDDSTMNQNKCESMGGNWHGAPTCRIFAATAQVEAMTNLYFNQFINPDLSEQYIVCKDGVSYNGSVLGGFCKYALDRFKSDYVVVEDALPYTASNCNCDDTIWDPLSERIRIDSFAEITPVSIDDVKRALVQYGPLATGKIPDPYGMDHHAMLLV